MGKDWNNHIGEPTEVEIIDKTGKKDTILISPLGMKDCAELMDIGKHFSKDENKNTEMMTKEMTERIMNLESIAIKLANPEIPEEALTRIVIRNWGNLIVPMFNINFGTTSEASALQVAKKIRENAQV